MPAGEWLARSNPAPVENRAYGIAGADLNAGVPSVETMTAAATSAIDGAVDDFAALDDVGGQVRTTVNTGISGLVQGSAGSLEVGTVSTVITIGGLDLSGLPQQLTGSISDGAVTIDLSNSSATVDLAALRGGASGFNGLPPNTVVGIDPTRADGSQPADNGAARRLVLGYRSCTGAGRESSHLLHADGGGARL
ncbi:choice-of-anchor G family protein [Arthrobacter sp. SA17]